MSSNTPHGTRIFASLETEGDVSLSGAVGNASTLPASRRATSLTSTLTPQ
ncbi:MAG TPA: hypothetical protein VF779_07440 [Pyrinomonadaceae bacterium]